MAQRSYTREEMEEILRRAAERTQRAEDGVRHDDLVAAAREVGIDPDAIDDALAELGEEKTIEAASARWTRDARTAFVSHFSAYAIVMAFLGSLNYLTTPHVAWAVWVALGWGLGVAFSARRALLAPSTEQVERLMAREEKRAAKKARREAQKQAAEAWRRRWKELGDEARLAAEARKRRGSVLAQAEKEIDRAIEEGVTALVSALGKRATSAAQTLSGERRTSATDFERYVEKKKGVTPAPISTGVVRGADPTQFRRPGAPGTPAEIASRTGPIVTPPPRTRVEVDARDEEEDVDEVRARRRRSR